VSGGDGGGWPRGSLLSRFSEAARVDALSLGTAVEFAARSRLLHQGARSSHVFLLVDGVVKVTTDTADGRSALLAVRVAGDAVGELAGLVDQPRIASVTAVGLVRARRISKNDFLALFDRHPDAGRAVSASVASKLREATRRRIDFGTEPVPVRLARLLIDLAAQHGHRADDRLTVGVTLSQPELADLIGSSEPSVYRALRDLRESGVLATGYRHFVVLDEPELRLLAGPAESAG
jgi:CRP/FNR family transcriptional regulator, cyclic AMP receptor protein